jgi:hypothetical protein
MGWVSKHGKLWCVHNEATGRVIVAKGKRRCYRSRQVALQTWYRLDCKYTRRHCEKIRKRSRQ